MSEQCSTLCLYGGIHGPASALRRKFRSLSFTSAHLAAWKTVMALIFNQLFF